MNNTYWRETSLRRRPLTGERTSPCFCFFFTCNHRHRGRRIVLWCHEPVHYGVLLVPLLVRVRGLFAEAVVELLQELEAFPGHRTAVGAEERVDEHAGGRETGGYRRRRRRGDFGRRSHGPVVLGRQTQHAVGSSGSHRVGICAADAATAADSAPPPPPVEPMCRRHSTRTTRFCKTRRRIRKRCTPALAACAH